MRHQLLISTLSLLLHCSLCYGQTCPDKLQRAQKLYNEGKLQEIEELLMPCLSSSGFSIAEKVSAYELIIKARINSNRYEKADELVPTLLLLAPGYDLDLKSHQPEYLGIFQPYRRYPKFLLGGEVGGNRSAIQNYRIFALDSANLSHKGYKSTTGFQAGAHIAWSLSSRIYCKTAIFYQVASFAYEQSKLLESANLRYEETQTLMSLPIGLNIHLNPWRVNQRHIFYTLLGANSSLLLSAKSGASHTNKTGASISDVDYKQLRNKLHFAVFAGMGLKLKVGMGFLTIESRFDYSLNNAVIAAERYTHQDMIHEFGYLDDDFLFHTLSFNIGFQQPLYIPKKIR